MTLQEIARPTRPVFDCPVASVSADGAATVVAIHGEADLFTLPAVVEVLARAIADSDGPVVIDLGQTEFIDTATLRAVGRAWEFLGDRGRALTVRSPSGVAVRMMALLGLSALVEEDAAQPRTARSEGFEPPTF